MQIWVGRPSDPIPKTKFLVELPNGPAHKTLESSSASHAGSLGNPFLTSTGAAAASVVVSVSLIRRRSSALWASSLYVRPLPPPLSGSLGGHSPPTLPLCRLLVLRRDQLELATAWCLAWGNRWQAACRSNVRWSCVRTGPSSGWSNMDVAARGREDAPGDRFVHVAVEEKLRFDMSSISWILFILLTWICSPVSCSR